MSQGNPSDLPMQSASQPPPPQSSSLATSVVSSRHYPVAGRQRAHLSKSEYHNRVRTAIERESQLCLMHARERASTVLCLLCSAWGRRWPAGQSSVLYRPCTFVANPLTHTFLCAYCTGVTLLTCQLWPMCVCRGDKKASPRLKPPGRGGPAFLMTLFIHAAQE